MVRNDRYGESDDPGPDRVDRERTAAEEFSDRASRNEADYRGLSPAGGRGAVGRDYNASLTPTSSSQSRPHRSSSAPRGSFHFGVPVRDRSWNRSTLRAESSRS